MHARSILRSRSVPGDGGGVCSYAARPLDFGRSAKVTLLAEDDEVVDARGRWVVEGDDGTSDGVLCAVLTLFAGGEAASDEMEDLERDGRCALEDGGSWIPRAGSDNDFRLVL